MHDLNTIIQRNSEEYLKRRGLERDPEPFRPVISKLDQAKERRRQRLARRLERDQSFDVPD